MFLESPMQGAGPVRYTYQLSDWTGFTQYNAEGRQEIPAHNLALAVLAETGLIGFTPYFAGPDLLYGRSVEVSPLRIGWPCLSLCCSLFWFIM